ncbi:hypothetical protein [Candidatus Tokpelaia sp.]|uniref:hypothetical protein n=1 Tax=Candidatus Tokpelaia sp. TaxID=2233777 RepID=UPI00123B8151|nr:hypothetical protein [Candidatus Tokpelaia sp.]
MRETTEKIDKEIAGQQPLRHAGAAELAKKVQVDRVMSEAVARPQQPGDDITAPAQGKFPTREVVLEKSKIKVTIPDDWTLADSMAAQKAARKDTAKFPLYLAQRICLFNGERRAMAWIEDNIHGKDGLQLIGELFGGDEGQEAGSATGTGNSEGNG